MNEPLSASILSLTGKNDNQEILTVIVCVSRVMAVPATVIYFTCYDQLRDFLRYNLGFQGSHVPLVAGGLARRESCLPPAPISTL